MIIAFLIIRFKQLLRALIGIGVFRLFVLVVILFLIALGMLLQISKEPNVFIVAGVFLFIILTVHLKREDKLFLKTYYDHFKLLHFIEYFILSVPLIIMLFIHNQWLIVPVYIPFLFVIPFINIKTTYVNYNTKLQKLIPDNCFEWKGGLRKNLLSLSFIWILGFSTSFFIGSVPLVLFILGLFPLSFYEKGESLQMLLAWEIRTKSFLLIKIKNQILLFSVLSIPLIIAFVLFHPERWYIPLVEFILLLSFQIYIIVLKYAFYKPNMKSGGAQMFSAFGTISIFMPFFIPVVWILTVWFWFKSLKTLNFYFDDYN